MHTLRMITWLLTDAKSEGSKVSTIILTIRENKTCYILRQTSRFLAISFQSWILTCMHAHYLAVTKTICQLSGHGLFGSECTLHCLLCKTRAGLSITPLLAIMVLSFVCAMLWKDTGGGRGFSFWFWPAPFSGFLEIMDVSMRNFSQHSETVSAVSQYHSIAPSGGWLPWHLFVSKSCNFGRKFQVTVSPHGQLPWHQPPWIMSHGPYLWTVFLSTTSQLSSKGILRHFLMGIVSDTPENSFLVSAPFVAFPLSMACFGTQEDGFPMNLANVIPWRIFMPCSRPQLHSLEQDLEFTTWVGGCFPDFFLPCVDLLPPPWV